jgi:hypothetical protein
MADHDSTMFVVANEVSALTFVLVGPIQGFENGILSYTIPCFGVTPNLGVYKPGQAFSLNAKNKDCSAVHAVSF